MNKNQDREAGSGGRSRAEMVPGADADARKLLQELQAHQAVLERQNEELKQLELELMAARNNLDSILNAVPDLLFELGLDGCYYNFWSPHTELLATPPEAFLGKRLSDVLPPDTAAICLAALQEANEKKYSMGRQYELSLGGENRWFELSVARKDEVYADGPRFVALCRDITERKQAEQDLRTLYTAIEQSPISVAITDVDANIQYVNPHFTKVTGYAAEVVGKNPRMFQSGQTLPETYRDMWDKITHGQNWQGELLNRRKNGELYWEEIHITPVTDAAGSIINYVCLMLDINQRKKTEQVTVDLLWQNRALAKRMFATEEEGRRKMSRELHDELGQWLTAIQAETEAINSMSGNSEPIRASVAAINQSADAMHEVIRRMVHSLRPSMLDTLGLADSLHELEKQWCQPRLGISCSFMLAGELEDLSDNLKITIFRLVQEALNNIASYAKANNVSVQLHREAGDVPDAEHIYLVSSVRQFN